MDLLCVYVFFLFFLYIFLLFCIHLPCDRWIKIMKIDWKIRVQMSMTDEWVFDWESYFREVKESSEYE